MIKEIKQIEAWYNKVCKEWDKKVLKHVNSKESEVQGHVTEEEHLTGERASRLEGEIKAFEKVLDLLKNTISEGERK